MQDYLSVLNFKQYDAVTTEFQYVRVIAGAGSGKTRVLTSRLAFLIEHMQVNPKRILAITFTNKAAKEMKGRVEKILEVEACPSIISTYHSFCARFLREEISHIGYTKSFTIIDEEDQKKVIKDVKQDIDKDKLFKPDQLLGFISNCKMVGNIKIDEDDKESELSIKYRIFLAYEKFLKDNNYLDFDDLILKTIEVLDKYPEVKKKWQNRFDHILIDEFQDTNDEEYHIVKSLMKEDSSIYVVGDPDQTIYTWRGANLDIIMDFKHDFKGTQDYVLDMNYRSTQQILDAANELIKNNKQRLSKDLLANSRTGDKPFVYNSYNDEFESEYIANTIYTSIRNNDSLNYFDFAVFYRSNYYSRSIEQQLIKLRIPYKIYGGVRFYERMEVKDALAYLRLICDDGDVLAFTRIINTPRRGIGDVTLNKIMLESAEKGITPYQYIKEKYENTSGELGKFVELIEDYKKKIDINCSPNFGTVLKDLLDDSGYIYTIDNNDEEERLDNLRELDNLLFECQQRNANITLKEILQDIALYSAQDEITNTNCVSLMTVHTAKGLEFPIVFVAGMAENVFPNRRSCEESRNSEKAMEEERRLAYVAFTRAKDKLYLTYNTGYDFQTANNKMMSRFIQEAEKKLNFNNQTSRFGYANLYQKKEEQKPVKKAVVQPRLTDYLSDTDFRPGNLVEHATYGQGIIINVLEFALEIAFKDPSVGVIKISKKFSGLKKIGG